MVQAGLNIWPVENKRFVGDHSRKGLQIERIVLSLVVLITAGNLNLNGSSQTFDTLYTTLPVRSLTPLIHGALILTRQVCASR